MVYLLLQNAQSLFWYYVLLPVGFTRTLAYEIPLHELCIFFV